MKNIKIKILFLGFCLFFSTSAKSCCKTLAIAECEDTTTLPAIYKFLARSPRQSIGCEPHSIELVQLLRARPDDSGQTVLHYAIANRDPKAVHFLLQLGFDPNFPPQFNPLYVAVWQRTHDKYKKSLIADNQIIMNLLDTGALIDTKTLVTSVESGLDYPTHLLLSKKPSSNVLNGTISYSKDALGVAIINRDQKNINSLLEAGAQVKSSHIVESVKKQFPEITQMLLLQQLPLEIINTRGTNYHYTWIECPLSIAVQNNDHEHITMLLAAGATVDSDIFRQSIRNKNYNITKQLLATRPNQQLLDYALHDAVLFNDLAHIQMFIDAGANHANDSIVWEHVILHNNDAYAILLLNKNAPSSALFCSGISVEQFAKKRNPEIYKLIQARKLIDHVAQQNQKALLQITYTRDKSGNQIPKYPKEIIGYIAKYLRSPAQEWQNFVAQPLQKRCQLINFYEQSLRRTYIQKLKQGWKNFWSKHPTLHKFTPMSLMCLIGSRLQALCFWRR